MRHLRAETDAVFRVDANGAWTPEEAARKIEQLARLGVELVEQPLPAEDWEGARWLFPRSALPLFADESCRTEEDLARCEGCFHGINIKLVKCGGLTPARRLAEEARRRGFRVMVGCMTESTIGISAAAQLLPLVDAADLDGAVLLAEDLAEGVRLERGRVEFPDRPAAEFSPPSFAGFLRIGRDQFRWPGGQFRKALDRRLLMTCFGAKRTKPRKAKGHSQVAGSLPYQAGGPACACGIRQISWTCRRVACRQPGNCCLRSRPQV